MRHAGLEGRAKKRWRTTTIPDPDVERARDLIQRDFGPCTEIDRRYVGDITYIATWEGWAYLATVIDLASRKVVGWALADHMRTELVTDALDAAFTTRQPPPGAIFHSDRGCQYTSIDYGNFARANGVVLSVGRTGQCWDNAVAESFFATIKRELIDTRAWPTRAGLRAAIFDWIEGWYNTRRLHSSLGYLSPAEYEATIHHHADRSGGMINTANLSVEPRQAQTSPTADQALHASDHSFRSGGRTRAPSAEFQHPVRGAAGRRRRFIIRWSGWRHLSSAGRPAGDGPMRFDVPELAEVRGRDVDRRRDGLGEPTSTAAPASGPI